MMPLPPSRLKSNQRAGAAAQLRGVPGIDDPMDCSYINIKFHGLGNELIDIGLAARVQHAP